MRIVNLTIERSYRATSLTTRAKQTAGLLLAVICSISGIARPGYCRSLTVSSQSAIAPAANSAWNNTGHLKTARHLHTATLLPGGRVLVVGGENGGNNPVLSSAELYDPDTGTWSYADSLKIGRESHTATLLANGKVLVAGGWNDRDGPLNSVEIYDPATGTWTGAASLDTVRSWHTATLLPDGKVLLVGASTTMSL